MNALTTYRFLSGVKYFLEVESVNSDSIFHDSSSMLIYLTDVQLHTKLYPV